MERKGQRFERKSSLRFQKMIEKRREGGEWPTSVVGWCQQFLFFDVPCQFSKDIGKWPENQILIPDWAYFHCPGATLMSSVKVDEGQQKIKTVRTNQQPNLKGSCQSIFSLCQHHPN